MEQELLLRAVAPHGAQQIPEQVDPGPGGGGPLGELRDQGPGVDVVGGLIADGLVPAPADQQGQPACPSSSRTSHYRLGGVDQGSGDPLSTPTPPC
ncbi:hypothetical protein [Streptomyces atratus]|uniref:hypothetical protein n=1 Tax=Streptomyces atratus TaxID=1893 RepID=UPI003528B471